MSVSWSWTSSNGQCENCDHIAKSETNFYHHKKICNDKMSATNHTKSRGYSLFKDMVDSKKIEVVKALWQSRKSEQSQLRDCFDSLAEEVRLHNLENKRLNGILKMAQTMETAINELARTKLHRSDSDSYNELLDGPREKKTKVDDTVPIAPGAPDAQGRQALSPQQEAQGDRQSDASPLQSEAQSRLPDASAPQLSLGYTPIDATGGVATDGVTILNPLSSSSSSSSGFWFGR